MRARVVICGSFHRDPNGLLRIFRELEATGCRILSPISLDFGDRTAPIVRTHTESGLTTAELEKFHVRAIRDADFIWLHAPHGYVGISCSYELGFATALHKPVFCFQTPEDEMLKALVRPATSVFEALETISLA